MASTRVTGATAFVGPTVPVSDPKRHITTQFHCDGIKKDPKLRLHKKEVLPWVGWNTVKVGGCYCWLKLAIRYSLAPLQRNSNLHSKTLHKSLPTGEANVQKFELGGRDRDRQGHNFPSTALHRSLGDRGHEEKQIKHREEGSEQSQDNLGSQPWLKPREKQLFSTGWKKAGAMSKETVSCSLIPSQHWKHNLIHIL